MPPSRAACFRGDYSEINSPELICMTFDFSDSGIILSRFICNKPFFKSADFTTTSAARENCNLKARAAIPWCSNSPEELFEPSWVMLRLLSLVSTVKSSSLRPATAT